MRHQSLIVKRYLRSQRKWKRLRKFGPSWELAQVESEVRALAWVLGVDPESDVRSRYHAAEMTSPETGAAPLAGVRLTRAWLDDVGQRHWLLEVPADGHEVAQYWAAFIPEKYVADLGVCFAAALFGSHPAQMLELSGRQERADQPTVASMRALLADMAAMAGDTAVHDGETRTGGAA